VAQDKERQRDFVNAVMSHPDTLNAGNCLDKLLIMRPNTTYSYSSTVFYYTLQVSADQICHHQVDAGYTKRSTKGERPVFKLLQIIIISFQSWNNKVKTIT